jgi:hypothetical protein
MHHLIVNSLITGNKSANQELFKYLFVSMMQTMPLIRCEWTLTPISCSVRRTLNLQPANRYDVL